MISNDPLVDSQWHLENFGQTFGGGPADIDLDVEEAWSQTKGQDVVIGFVADGIQHDHPDLIDRFLPGLSYNFVENNTDTLRLDYHDTAVAGIAIATGDNGIGVSGIAPEAKFATLRIDTGNQGADAVIANALSHERNNVDIYNNSWGPWDNGEGLDLPGPLVSQALEDGVRLGRNGLGNIFVWAAGNGLQFNDNVNYDGYANSRYTIAATGIDFTGKQADYSEPGASIFVAAHSSGGGEALITTTVYQGNGSANDGYSSFGMTSGAAPVVSGVAALILGENPNLGWRDVQHILANTAVKTDPTDSGWQTNGAGFNVNHKYGFGAVNAGAAVTLAGQWQNVGEEVAVTSGEIDLNLTIPDNNAAGLTSTVNIDRDIQVEWAEVVFDASHSNRGNLAVTLISPDGTESFLTEVHNDPADNYESWALTSIQNWGESALGDWTLRVSDGTAGEVGTWNSWKLNLYGTDDNGVLGGGGGDPGGEDPEPPTGIFVVPDDAIVGTPNGEYLPGANGDNDEYFLGDGSSDYIWAGPGDDIINATSAELKGAGEWDQLLGAAGADTFILGDASNVYYAAQGDADVAFMPDFEAGVDKVVLHGSASDYVLSPNGQGEVWLSLTNGESIAGFVTSSSLSLDQFLYATEGSDPGGGGGDPDPTDPFPVPADAIVGTANGEYLPGGNGEEYFVGGGGSDYIWAGPGDDIINATSAELRGDGEWDQLLGAGGADTFLLGDATGAYYAAQGDSDVAFMPDFEAGIDQVVLHGSASDYVLSPNGQGEVWLSLTSGESIAGFATSSTLSLSDFQYLV